MVFFLVWLDRTIKLHPKHFGPKLYDTLAQKLQEEMEGKCTGRYGFVVTTMYPTRENIQDGHVDAVTGFAHFKIRFSAIICRPFKGEVIDAVVTTVNKMGFFAEAGPLQIFVSNKLMPDDMTFDSQGSPSYVSADSKISKDDAVRIKIVGTRVDTNEIFSIGSIRDDYCGLCY